MLKLAFESLYYLFYYLQHRKFDAWHHRKYRTWIGGSILASLSTFKKVITADAKERMSSFTFIYLIPLPNIFYSRSLIDVGLGRGVPEGSLQVFLIHVVKKIFHIRTAKPSK